MDWWASPTPGHAERRIFATEMSTVLKCILSAYGVTVAAARAGDRHGLVAPLPGVGAEHLYEHPHREDRGDHQQAVAEEGVQADGFAQCWPAVQPDHQHRHDSGGRGQEGQ